MDIQQIRRDIEGDLEDARFMAFMTLYASDEDVAQQEINRILEMHDPILKLMFLRFLAHVPEEKSVRYICRMMENHNTVVMEAARRAYEQNRFEDRLNVLMPLMRSQSPMAQRFAIESVGRAGRMDAVDELLALMQGADEDLLLVILTALRFLPSAHSVGDVLVLLKDPREEVRFRAALVCGELIESGSKQLRGPLLALLKDPSSRVRRAVLWGMRQHPDRHDVDVLIDISRNDPDPMVRQDAIVNLSQFPIQKVVRLLLQMLVTESNRWVSLKCESVFMGMPSRQLTAGLNWALGHTEGSVRNKAILLAADYKRGSEHYFKFLLNGLVAASSDKERIPYLEALGIFGSSKAVPVLLMYVYGSPVVSYVAMSSLLKVHPDQDVYLNYLEKPEGSMLIKQIVLRYLVLRPFVDEKYRDRLVECLMQFLRGDNINVRYLAAQVLIHIAGEKAQEALLDAVEHETDPASLQLLRGSLVDFFTKDPQGFVDLLSRRRRDAAAFSAMGMLLQEVIWSPGDLLAQLPALLSPDLVGDDVVYLQNCVTWLANQLLQGRVPLEEVMHVLKNIPKADDVVIKLASILTAHPSVRLSISADTCRRWLTTANDRVRGAIIDLMSVAHDATSIPVLVSIVCNDRMAAFHQSAVRALGRITEMTHD